MLFGRIGRLETEFTGDFCACGRRTRSGDSALDQIKNLLLAGSEFRTFKHTGSLSSGWAVCLYTLFSYPVTVFSTSFLILASEDV